MNDYLQNHVMDDPCLSIKIDELHPIHNTFDEDGDRLGTNEFLSLNEMLSISGLSFGKELESIESLMGRMELSILQDDTSKLNFSACSVGCAGNCSESCSSILF